MFRVESMKGWEVLDSRGRPTVAARVVVNGMAGEASIPSGASTGSAEACELRDGEPGRYGGLGVGRAAANIGGALLDIVKGRTFEDQSEFDRALIDGDGSPDKSRLGANALLAASIGFARAAAQSASKTLFSYFAGLAGNSQPSLPRPMINLFSGGKHAGGQVAIQDVLIVPMQGTIDECLSTTYAVYYAAAAIAAEKYGARALKADEGGLAPPFPSIEAMFDDAVAAIRKAGFRPGEDVALAVDVASTHFYRHGRYELGEQSLESHEMARYVRSWVDRWPIVSVEDGLAENDWDNWPALCRSLSGRSIVLGDDLLCTNPMRIRRAVETGACNALLLKVNQIGTLTESAESLKLARDDHWKIVVSARSGETEDHWLADLAVGWSGDFIKVGSICQSERLAKYNRLLRIEREDPIRLLVRP
jgi:enolase